MLHRAFCYCSVIVLLSGHQTEGRRNVRGATRRDVLRAAASHHIKFISQSFQKIFQRTLFTVCGCGCGCVLVFSQQQIARFSFDETKVVTYSFN